LEIGCTLLSPTATPDNRVPYLRLLGGARIEEDGKILSGRVAQKRRLAILALLATAPRHAMSRDRIMSLIWPDRNDDGVRRLLSAAVYEIRKELGEEVLVTRGDEVVLDLERLPTDIDAFEAAVEAGDAEAAVQLGRGTFLDDFVLRGSVEFEQWLDATREHYASRYRQALEQLARERAAGGNRVGAVEAWRELAALDPFNSRVALGLVGALAAAGNRAGALKSARVHELLVQDEFGVDPDPEFARAIVALRDPSPATEPPPANSAEPGARAGAEPPDRHDPAPGSLPVHHSLSDAPAPLTGPPARSDDRRRATWSRAWLRRALASPRWRGGFLVMALLGVVIGILMVHLRARVMEAGGSRIVVAVLPLEAMDSADAAWADGLTEQLIEVLSALPGVDVTIRSAAFALRASAPIDALRRLDADLALTGVARRGPDSVSVQLELSGPGERVEWTRTYTRPTDEVVRIGTWKEIAVEVQAQLAERLGSVATLAAGPMGGEAVAADRGGWTDDPIAYELYQQGRMAWLSLAPDGFARALRYFSGALERDSLFARAWSGLADVHNLVGSYDYGVAHPDSAYPRARAAAERALQLAPEFHEAWAALAHTLYVYDRDWDAADAAYREALRLNPRFAQGHHRYSLYLVAMGRTSEAMEAAERALALDSISSVMNAAVARQRYFQRDYLGALEGYEKARRLDPGYFHPYLGVGLSLLALGRPEDAAQVLQQALELTGGSHPLPLTFLSVALTHAGDPSAAVRGLRVLARLRAQGIFVPFEYDAVLQIALGSFDEALDLLEAAYENNSSVMAYLNVHPLADPLRDHPRFKALVERVGLPPAEHEPTLQL
jgi:DNA-binding SARP family transcriptional activator/tetratricopeptide (TPR) repeat protein/TolB-like protein